MADLGGGFTVDTGLHAVEIAVIFWVAVFRLGGMAQVIQQHSKEITALNEAVNALGALRISDASDRERMAALDQRMIMQGQRIDEGFQRTDRRMDDLSRRIDENRRDVKTTRGGASS